MARPGPAPGGRRGYLDWLRGLAVVVMIEAHLLDSWTRLDQRGSALFSASMIVGGFGAPLFLYLAGLSVSLSAGSKMRRSGNPASASGAVIRRGVQIFGLAFLFRLQACIVSWGPWRSLLKVDILNIMGPAIMAAGSLWGWFSSPRTRCLAFAAAALAVGFLTPPVRATSLLAPLPDPVEGYLRPPGLTNFSFFPWAGFVFAGALAGVLIDRTRTGQSERRLVVRVAAAGAIVALLSLGASYVPSPFERSEFWTSSPSFFFLRTGVLTAAIGAAYAWERRSPDAKLRWSGLQQLGRTSLFIYWIHVEMIYGLAVRPLHKSLSLPAAWAAVIAFSAFMLACSIAKERIARRLTA